MTDAAEPARPLARLRLQRSDRVAVVVAPNTVPARAAALAHEITIRLDRVGVPPARRTWIIADSGAQSDRAAARLAALLSALSDVIGAAPLILHDPRDPDALIFQRRPPHLKRGGIFLNAKWIEANQRIALGDPGRLLAGLAGWFVPPDDLDLQIDFNPDLVLAAD